MTTRKSIITVLVVIFALLTVVGGKWLYRTANLHADGTTTVAVIAEVPQMPRVTSMIQRHGIRAKLESTLEAYVYVPTDQVCKARFLLAADSVVHWYRVEFP
jgi:hypothetical protein